MVRSLISGARSLSKSHERTTGVAGRVGRPDVRVDRRGQFLVEDVLEEGALAVYGTRTFEVVRGAFDLRHVFRGAHQVWELQGYYLLGPRRRCQFAELGDVGRRYDLSRSDSVDPDDVRAPEET